MKITATLLCINLAAGTALISGCATQPRLTHEQAITQHQQLGQLETRLQQAKEDGAEILAPQGYAKANLSFSKAMAAALTDRGVAANTAAAEGLKMVETLNRDAQSSRDILGEVLQVRDRAYAADAKNLLSDKIEALDEDLKKTAALVEKGDLEKAKQLRPKLIADYSQLELTALKQGAVEKAKTAIVNAKKQGAEKHAPKTILQAEEEMALTTSILNADRTQTERADQHASKAKWLAERSASITETVKDFARRNYTMEEIVLWQQQQLATANQPFEEILPFNEPGDKAALHLKTRVANLLAERDALQQKLNIATEAEQLSQAQLKAAETTIAALTTANRAAIEKQQSSSNALLSARDAELSRQLSEKEAETEKQNRALEEKERAEQKKFEAVQAMFTAKEANVYRQLQNVLISAHGFQFPSGQSEIQADNFPLMNKIVEAIKIFPSSQIEVIGHTDSLGNDATNQKLSEARAEKVTRFLKEVGSIEASRISSDGFGEVKPVSSNETTEGRAENRRVEIRIINK